MDLAFYNNIKNSNEYRELLKMGYYDKTTPIQLKNGTLDFTHNINDEWEDDRYSIYCDKIQKISNSQKDFLKAVRHPIIDTKQIIGAVRYYTYSGYYGDQLKIGKAFEMHISSYDDYIKAIQRLIDYIKKRNRKYLKACYEYRHVTFKEVFENSQMVSIRVLYNRILEIQRKKKRGM